MEIPADLALGTGAVTAPWWVQELNIWLGAWMLIAGSILVGLRLYVVWRDWGKKNDGKL